MYYRFKIINGRLYLENQVMVYNEFQQKLYRLGEIVFIMSVKFLPIIITPLTQNTDPNSPQINYVLFSLNQCI